MYTVHWRYFSLIYVFLLQCGRYNYGSVTGALCCVCRTEGPTALFSGLMATLLRDVPFSGIYVMFYSQTKAMLPEGEKGPLIKSTTCLSCFASIFFLDF